MYPIKIWWSVRNVVEKWWVGISLQPTVEKMVSSLNSVEKTCQVWASLPTLFDKIQKMY